MRTPRCLTGSIAFARFSLFTLLTALGLSAALVPLSRPAMAQAAAPRTVGFMGMLRGADSQPKPDGAYTVRLALYTAPTGGTAVWSETKSVQVSGGLFSAVLGGSAANPFPASLDFSSALFVGVTLGTDAEMTPRMPLQGAPYAMFAHTVADGAVSEAKIAVGAVGPRQLAGDAASLAQVTEGLMRVDPSGRIGIGVANPAASLDVGGSGAIKLPVGTTSQRPVLPVEGMLRGNTTSHAPEYYTGAGWLSLGAGGGPGNSGGTADTVTASLAIAPGGYTSYNVDASAGTSGAITLTLPDAAAVRGVTYIIRKVDNTRNRVAVRPQAGQRIDGLSVRAVRLPNEELRLESDGATWRASQRPEPVFGGWNLDQGLQRWRQSWGLTARRANGTGFGGVDVLVYGDSIAEGGVTTSYLFGGWAHRLKLRLQDRLNPPGVVGGYGFVPSVAATSVASWPGITDGVNYGLESQNGKTLILRGVQKTSATTVNHVAGAKGTVLLIQDGDKVQFAFDGTDPEAARKRLGVTRVEMLGHNIAAYNYGGPIWDVFDSLSGYAAQATGTGIQSGATVPARETNNQWGRRYAVGGQQNPLDPTKRNLIQITGPAGVNTAPDLIAYNGDYDCGVRLHGLGYWGQTTASAATFVGWKETMDTFGSGAGSVDANGNVRGGAVNARLVMFNYITNDSAVKVPLSSFKANYGSFIDRALALPTRPSVLLVIPPVRMGLPAAEYREYVTAVYELAEERDDVAIVDLWKFINNAPAPNFPGAELGRMGWYADGTHYSDAGQEGIANVVYDAIAG